MLIENSVNSENSKYLTCGVVIHIIKYMTTLSEVEMKTYSKTCLQCNTPFIGKGPSAKYCEPCASERMKASQREGTARYRLKNGLIKNPGVGKGGANNKGKEDDQYKNGIVFFMKNRRRIKEEKRYCERCNKDLLDAGHYGWVIHHRDHDRNNNVESNFELLCKSCHQKEHDCHLAFSKRAETISSESKA